jgi:benzoyl-CoA reductase/2-hydroxyglutaryl-CoA dehydratase subunit BcrC/BadD/HgdB
MPKEEFNPKLQKLLDSQVSQVQTSGNKLRLFISGSVCNHAQIFELFDKSAAHVVGDDLCTGWRYFSEDASADGDPIEALADRLIRRVPCPCKHNPLVDRSVDLIQRVKEARAQGVIFLLLKFCDPHAFDYPYLKEKLLANNIPSLLMEIEPGSMPLGAVETRLQAFIETLGG